MVLEEMREFGHEQVTVVHDEATGLCAIVAIHDTTLGPSLGGTRLRPYDTEADALRDVLRLSRAMTHKAAVAGLDLGGGKAVILADPDEKSPDLLRAYGRAVDGLGGRYITSIDLNTDIEDMDVVFEETDHVAGRTAGSGDPPGLGEPSEVTAYGVLLGIEACCEAVYGVDSVADRSVLVQGLGKVGASLADQLLERGASVTVSDVDADAVAAFCDRHDGVEAVPPAAVTGTSCDVFAPCAIGGVVDDDSIDRLDCDVIAGSANNVLERREHAQALADRDILYAPDYVINAGGLITVATEYRGGSREDALANAERIGDRLGDLIERARSEDTTVLAAADRYAEERIERGE